MPETTKREISKARKIAAILTFLQNGPAEMKTIAEAIHLSRRATRPYVTELMHRDNRRVHVSGWYKDPATPGLHSPLFALGDKVDVPCPPPLTNSEKLAQWRKKTGNRRSTLKRDIDSYDLALAKRRAKALPIMRDPLVEALFGKVVSNVGTGPGRSIPEIEGTIYRISDAEGEQDDDYEGAAHGSSRLDEPDGQRTARSNSGRRRIIPAVDYWKCGHVTNRGQE